MTKERTKTQNKSRDQTNPVIPNITIDEKPREEKRKDNPHIKQPSIITKQYRTKRKRITIIHFFALAINQCSTASRFVSSFALIP